MVFITHGDGMAANLESHPSEKSSHEPPGVALILGTSASQRKWSSASEVGIALVRQLSTNSTSHGSEKQEK